ncbi:coiled-coil domain-containing protein 166-like [Cervus elaphus]|uniref:coiled-coil domain-containing protein 166-like n=1 Tax=Cervus elaphus TaxID=9860 RepID=UPI001CC27FF8|nr:coiled-coil domain-containing protein 166-like [Cervus elaphus]
MSEVDVCPLTMTRLQGKVWGLPALNFQKDAARSQSKPEVSGLGGRGYGPRPIAPKKKGPRSGRQGAAAGEGAEPPLSERPRRRACAKRTGFTRATGARARSAALRCANSAGRRERESGVDLSQIYRQRAELTSIYRAREDGLGPGEELQLQQLARIRALERDLLQMRVEDMQLLHRARHQFLESKAALEREARQREAAGALLARIQATSIGSDRGPLRPELPPSHRAQALRNQPRQLPDHGELEDTRGLACMHGGASLGQSDRSNAGSKLPPLWVSHRPARLVRRSYSPSPPAPVDSDQDEAASGRARTYLEEG